MARTMDAAAILDALRALVSKRGLEDLFTLREGCVGGCSRVGPNVDLRIHAVPGPGEEPDHVAIGGRTYVYSLPRLDCLASILEENLQPAE